MLQKIKNRKESGFTIIEVLIVLAIAGLIMLVVFLAVPALQRNSRNTQYRNEASRLLGAYNEASSNNGGAVLTSADQTTVLDAANAKNITSLTIETYAGTTSASLTRAVIRTSAKCASPTAAATTAGSSRQTIILFLVETSGGTQLQCQEA